MYQPGNLDRIILSYAASIRPPRVNHFASIREPRRSLGSGSQVITPSGTLREKQMAIHGQAGPRMHVHRYTSVATQFKGLQNEPQR